MVEEFKNELKKKKTLTSLLITNNDFEMRFQIMKEGEKSII